jgi:hypothetical protein
MVSGRAVYYGIAQTVEEIGYCYSRSNEQCLYSVEQNSREVLSYRFFTRFAGTGYEHPPSTARFLEARFLKIQ